MRTHSLTHLLTYSLAHSLHSAHSATTDASETQLEEEVDAQAKEILFNQHCQEIDEYLDRYCCTVRLVMSDDVGTACKDEPPQHVSYVPIRGEDGNEEMIPLYDEEDPLYEPQPPDAVVIGRIKSMRVSSLTNSLTHSLTYLLT